MINAARAIASETLKRLSHHEGDSSASHSEEADIPAPVDENAPLVARRDVPFKLSIIQKAAVGCYAISYIGDIAGVLTAVIRIATGDKIPIYGEVLAQVGSIGTGAVASVADVRTIYNNMTMFAKTRARQQQELRTVDVQGPAMN